jgi:uncharacterized membrane protein YagU involved in acid resistance
VVTRVAFVAHVCHVARLLPCKVILIQISVTPSDMGEACSLFSNIEVLYHHVHMRFMIIFNYDYLVVKNDDTKNG